MQASDGRIRVGGRSSAVRDWVGGRGEVGLRMGEVVRFGRRYGVTVVYQLVTLLPALVNLGSVHVGSRGRVSGWCFRNRHKSRARHS